MKKFFRKYVGASCFFLLLLVALVLVPRWGFSLQQRRALGAGGAIALVSDGNGGSPNGSSPATVTLNTTGATLLVIIDSDFSKDPSSDAVTDTYGNTWHHLTTANDSGGGGTETAVWYAYNQSGSALVTGTSDIFSVTGSYDGITVSAWSGTQTQSDPTDAQNTNIGGTTSIQAGSITPSANGDLIISGVGENSNSEISMSVNSGLSVLDTHVQAPGVSIFSTDGYLIQATAATLNPLWTGAQTASKSAVIASFKAGSGGGGDTNAAITLIATSTITCGSGQCNGTSTAINTTGGSLIVITVGGATTCFDPNNDSFTDTAGNTFFHTTSTIDCAQSANGMTTWYAWNIATNSADRIEASGTSIAANIAVFSGVQTTSNPLDQWNAYNSTANLTAITVSTTTPSANNELIYSGESRTDASANCSSYSISTPMTLTGNCTLYNFNGYPTVFDAYNVQTRATGQSVTWTANDGENLHIAQVTTWKAAPAGVSTNTSGYAWGNKIGWVNFGTLSGGLTVDTTTITGYVWSQNFGWINMAPASSGVLNDGNGNLSGDAWSQNAGYINFSGVTINQNGVFEGIASGTIAGSLQFSSSTGCTDCNVSTTWTPPSSGGAVLTVSSVAVNGNNPSTLTLTPETTTNINVNATITDNTCGEITGGTTTILLYRSGVTSSTCMSSPNNLDCYIATAFTASSTCSGGTINTTTTFPVEYFAQATDASSSYPNQNWIGTVAFNDFTNPTSSADSTHSTSSNIMSTLVALNTSSNSGGGPIAVIATTTAICASPGDACSATSSAINTTGSSLLVVIIDDFQHDPSTSVVSDSLGNTWHHLTVDNNDVINSLEMVMWYAYNHGSSPLSTGSSDTFNVSGSNFPSVDISAYSGTQTSSDPFDQQSERAISSFQTTIQPGPITPAANGELLVSGEGFQNSEGADTIDSGFTTMNNANATLDQSLDAYYVQPSAAAIDPTWTGSANTTRLAIISSFKAAASGGSSSINYGILSPSSTTGSVNQSTTISNAGNASTSLQLSGVALTRGSSLIATSSQHYATSSFTFGGSEQSLSGSATTVSGFLLTSPTSTANVFSTIFWGVQIPSGTATGTYTGTNTFTAVFHA